MGRAYYDNTNRTFTFHKSNRDDTGTYREHGTFHFVVKFQRTKSQPNEVLSFPYDEPITLYETSHRAQIAAIVEVVRFRFRQGNRSADVVVNALSIPTSSSLRPHV